MKKNIYYEERKLKNADLNSFEVLDWCYAKDQNKVYYYDKVIEGADPCTFKILFNDDYSKDDNFVYYLGRKTEEEVLE